MPRVGKRYKMLQPTTNSRLFAVNQDVSIGKDLAGVVQGYYTNTDVIVRVRILELSKANEIYLKQFKCLTPNGSASRLYTINEKELLRHNEQKGKATRSTEKKSKRK